ncbi:hypothetical protein Dsin_002692 [Dipteronia sinensis]|uniref:RNase H type-1 domain-containing protein n=1 Tax=Dipteronia sinensis TaxID=43782 RepID=A0AAE0EJN2_9ROSI|nr:hypothetical protein Dsin_002692 [Dipteronia sinensis]
MVHGAKVVFAKDVVHWAEVYVEVFRQVDNRAEGLCFAYDFGLWPCVVESDSQVVVSLVNSVSSPLDEIGLFINDIVDLMNSSPQCKMCFIPRKANMVAHGLAKLGLSSESDRFWIEEVPPSVAPIVLGETSRLL